MEKLETEQLKIASRLLAKDPGRNRRSFIRDQSGRRGGRGGDSQLYKLFILQDMRRSDARAIGTNVECLGQLDKVHPKGISSPEEDGNLDANPRVLPLMGGGHGALCFKRLTRHWTLISTIELVHGQHIVCHLPMQ